MDGLSISNLNTLVGGQGLGEVRESRNSLGAPGAKGLAEPGKSFADTLKDAVQNVNAAQKEADVKMQDLATGKTQNIHDVMLSAEKADISLKLMVQVRNKIVEAYQEIMKMQA